MSKITSRIDLNDPHKVNKVQREYYERDAEIKAERIVSQHRGEYMFLMLLAENIKRMAERMQPKKEVIQSDRDMFND